MNRSHLAPVSLLALVAVLVTGAAAPHATPKSSKPTGTPAPDSIKTAGQRASGKTPIQTLVAAEQAFAALSASSGMKAAFMANLGDDAVVFRPLPVNGLSVWKNRPESKARLLWEPAYAEIAGSGDFGITTGPWELHPPAGTENAEVGYGQFFTVWTRTGRSPWKVAIDLGVSHPKPAEGGLGASTVTFGPEHPAPTGDAPPSDSLTLISMDRSISRMIAGLGANAIQRWIDSDARYLRDGSPPLLGAAARDSLTASIHHTAWQPASSRVARSGDLGFTYGVREDSTGITWQPPDTTAYLHVWRRAPAGTWKMAAIVETLVRRGAR